MNFKTVFATLVLVFAFVGFPSDGSAKENKSEEQVVKRAKKYKRYIHKGYCPSIREFYIRKKLRTIT